MKQIRIEKKISFLGGMECVAFRAITKIRNDSLVKDYLKNNLIVKKEETNFKVLTKEEYNENLLLNGYGIYFKGWVLFKKDKVPTRIEEFLKKEIENIKKYNPILMDLIDDICDYPVVRGYITRAKLGFIEKEVFIKGVNKYIKDKEKVENLYLKVKKVA